VADRDAAVLPPDEPLAEPERTPAPDGVLREDDCEQCGIAVWLVKLTEDAAEHRDRRYPDGRLFTIMLLEPQFVEPKPGRVNVRLIPNLRLAEFAEDGPLREHKCPAQTRTCKNCRAPLRAVW
jgi:hypothetical protein